MSEMESGADGREATFESLFMNREMMGKALGPVSEAALALMTRCLGMSAEEARGRLGDPGSKEHEAMVEPLVGLVAEVLALAYLRMEQELGSMAELKAERERKESLASRLVVASSIEEGLARKG